MAQFRSPGTDLGVRAWLAMEMAGQDGREMLQRGVVYDILVCHLCGTLKTICAFDAFLETLTVPAHR